MYFSQLFLQIWAKILARLLTFAEKKRASKAEAKQRKGRSWAQPNLVMGTSPKITNWIKSNRPGYESIRIESVIKSKYYTVSHVSLFISFFTLYWKPRKPLVISYLFFKIAGFLKPFFLLLIIDFWNFELSRIELAKKGVEPNRIESNPDSYFVVRNSYPSLAEWVVKSEVWTAIFVLETACDGFGGLGG